MSGSPTGWQNPKTNWQAADVPSPADLNRIEGNANAIETGSRTLDPAQAPSSNAGTLRQILSWFANRIKAIMGTTTWYDSPPTTLQAAKQHMDSATGHVPSGKYTAYTSRNDQAPSWGDIPDKPATFPPSAHGHAATEISNTPAGGISASNVQAALSELDQEKLGRGAADTDLEELRAFLIPMSTRKTVATAWDTDNRPTALEIRTPDDATVIATVAITYNADGQVTQVQAQIPSGGQTMTVTYTVVWDGEKYLRTERQVTVA